MMNAFALLPLALAAITVWLLLANIRASRARAVARSNYFAEIGPLFDNVKTRIEPTGFPRLTAIKGGHAFDLQAVPDSLTFRKLPALWVMLSLPQPMPVQATLDILSRATGQEPFTRFSKLPQSLPCPAFLPEGSSVRTDNAAVVIPQEILSRHGRLFTDPLVKELLISPKGLRIVILAEEAERGRYLLFRDSELGSQPLAASRLEPLLKTIIALRQDLIEAAKETS